MIITEHQFEGEHESWNHNDPVMSQRVSLVSDCAGGGGAHDVSVDIIGRD